MAKYYVDGTIVGVSPVRAVGMLGSLMWQVLL